MMLQSSTIRQRKAPPPGIYDPAGNILSKTVAGRTTTYTYDKANQLVSSKNADGKVTRYEYDAAGRMVKEGEKTFAYGWLDKVMQVAENGKTTQTYTYDMLGQLATADYGDSKETFLWDGLALLSRNNLKYVNEPAVTGGNPILAGDKMLFDDMLGNTLGVKDGEKFSAIDRDAFGELKPGEKPNLAVNFFTGKPEIDGLGYSFLFRNYRADLGKWQTTDPLGYPDGWNNLAYVNNGVTMNIDWLGLDIYHLTDSNGAVFGAGHSAWIVGNDKDGYTAYDYGPAGTPSASGSSGEPIPPKNFNTPGEAIDYLNSHRAEGHKYTQGQVLETTEREDSIANWSATAYSQENYNLFSHNCYQMGNKMIEDINRVTGSNYQISNLLKPNDAFQENYSKGWVGAAVE